MGNHEENAEWRNEAHSILSNATLLCNSGVHIDGLRIFGTGFYWPVETPFFEPPYAQIPTDTHVLVSHGPAKGHMDGGAGCPCILDHIARCKPLLFVCGHIHEARGVCLGQHERVAETIFVNAANEPPREKTRGACGNGPSSEMTLARGSRRVHISAPSRRQPMLAIINVGSDAAEADAMPRPPASNESSSMRDRPWVDSDTWYALSAAAETSHLFFNARTGTVREGPPDGLRDGIRLRSAPSSGRWAVPPTAPLPELPATVFAPGECAELLAPEISIFEDGDRLGCAASDISRRLIFSSPHGVNLARDGKPEHLPEDFTAYLAKAWAAHAQGLSLCWNQPALAWCAQHEKPLPEAVRSAQLIACSSLWHLASCTRPCAATRGLHLSTPLCAHTSHLRVLDSLPPLQRDPNYLTEAEADHNPWVAALASIPARARGMHVDVHGKADRAGEADLDVGVGALRAYGGDVIADTVADILANELRATLANACAAGATTSSGPDDPPGFSVDARPRLQGCWRSVPRRTLTQSSALLGYIPVQLELGYRLRKALGRDHELCKRVATAFVACEPRCLDHLEACHVALS